MIMEGSSTMFLDCPAYLDLHGAARCGLPAAVEDRYLAGSTDGPLESVRIRCPRGHWFNGPVQFLTCPEQPALADTSARPAAAWEARGDSRHPGRPRLS
jgi:hypothetical protein